MSIEACGGECYEVDVTWYRRIRKLFGRILSLVVLASHYMFGNRTTWTRKRFKVSVNVKPHGVLRSLLRAGLVFSGSRSDIRRRASVELKLQRQQSEATRYVGSLLGDGNKKLEADENFSIKAFGTGHNTPGNKLSHSHITIPVHQGKIRKIRVFKKRNLASNSISQTAPVGKLTLNLPCTGPHKSSHQPHSPRSYLCLRKPRGRVPSPPAVKRRLNGRPAPTFSPHPQPGGRMQRKLARRTFLPTPDGMGPTTLLPCLGR